MSNYEERIQYITQLVTETIHEIENNPYSVPINISARHVHLTKEHVHTLFGVGYELTVLKELSQVGQFAAAETVEVIGPKGCFKKVRVLGPERPETQVEIANSDGRILGVAPPVRTSGDLRGSACVKLRGPAGEVELSCGVIVADRHIHMSPQDATWYGVMDGDKVAVEVDGPKAGILRNITVRVSELYSLDVHIDTDDSNAFLIKPGQKSKLLV